MVQSHWLIKSTIRRVALRARGPALPIARGLLEQIPQFLSVGTPVEAALRESLLNAIYSAKIRANHCVGIERHALEDFIKVCIEMKEESEKAQNSSLEVTNPRIA